MSRNKKIIFFFGVVLLIFSISKTALSKSYTEKNNFSDTTIYVLKVIKKYDTFYAEWLDYHDKQTEDRYDAIECEVYCDNKKIGLIYLVQHWNQTDRKVFPLVGTTFKAEKFDLEQYYVPVQAFNVNFVDINIIE